MAKKVTHKLFERNTTAKPVAASTPVNAPKSHTSEIISALVNAPKSLAQRIVEYMQRKGYALAKRPGEVNIVYLEGSDGDGRPNADRLDGWNDRRIVIVYEMDGELPVIVHNAEATTEPGLRATMSDAAARRGGVARVQFGQFAVWQVGFHQEARNGRHHPALVQRRPLKVHRDNNRDGKRTGDALDWATGINQHSTRPNILPSQVGTWSEGCMVGRSWILHEQFMALVTNDPRYKTNPNFFFPTAVIAGDDFARAVPG